MEFLLHCEMISPLTLFVLHSRVPKIVMKCFEFCAPKQCLVHHHRHQKTIRSCLKIVKAFLDVHLLQTKYILLRIFVSIFLNTYTKITITILILIFIPTTQPCRLLALARHHVSLMRLITVQIASVKKRRERMAAQE